MKTKFTLRIVTVTILGCLTFSSLASENETFTLPDGTILNLSGVSESLEQWKKELESYIEQAKLGDAKAQYMLGLHYQDGLFISQNCSEAIKWIGKAVDQDYGEAQYSLGMDYEAGRCVDKNYIKAKEMYLKAAKKWIPCCLF